MSKVKYRHRLPNHMAEKKFLFGFAPFVAIVLAVFLSGCLQSASTSAPQGRAVFAITDVAADMGSVTSVNVTIDSVQAHNAAQGWVNVSSAPQTYDLLKLKAEGSKALLADVNMAPGAYQQVRLVISNVTVTDTSVHEAKLPSGELKIVGGFNVSENSTSAIVFDFIASDSLHVTGKGEYIFAPVVRFSAVEGAEVDASSSSDVRVQGGTTKSIEVGMALDGTTGEGVKVAKDKKLSIEGGKII